MNLISQIIEFNRPHKNAGNEIPDNCDEKSICSVSLDSNNGIEY